MREKKQNRKNMVCWGLNQVRCDLKRRNMWNRWKPPQLLSTCEIFWHKSVISLYFKCWIEPVTIWSHLSAHVAAQSSCQVLGSLFAFLFLIRNSKLKYVYSSHPNFKWVDSFFCDLIKIRSITLMIFYNGNGEQYFAYQTIY